jgi:hypothetical protein
MKSWKVLVPIIVLAVAVLVVVGIWVGSAVVGTFSKPIEAADAFLNLAGQNKMRAAYDSTAPELRQQQSFERFAAEMRKMRMTQFKSSSFPSIKISNLVATLTGSFSRTDGTMSPLRVRLISRDKTWQVFGISSNAAGASAGSSAEHIALVRRTLTKFSAAVKKADFTDLHATLARPFREQFGPEKLKKIFQVFIDKRVDISPALLLQPVFTTAKVQRSILTLDGYFPSTPSRVYFGLRYISEAGIWKPVRINVQLRKPGQKL